MMEIYILLVDFGLVVLIWLVQLIAYPSFRFFEGPGLLVWHKYYTEKITLFVVPLMFGQLGLHLYELINSTLSWSQTLSFLIIISTWTITFWKAVPLHRQIGAGENPEVAIKYLNKINWVRTILWSVVFVISFLKFKANL